MANYFDTVSNPGPVTGSTPVHESVASSIGAALGGVAKILDVGLKTYDEHQQNKVLGTLEDKLHEQTSAFEKPDPVEDQLHNGLLRHSWDTIDAFRQQRDQGRMDRAAFMGRTSEIVQGMIHDHPRFADSIRERAQKVLGTNPTAEMLNLEGKDEEYAKTLQRTIQQKQVEGAIEHGVAVLKPDGTYDVKQMAAEGVRWQATDTRLKNLSAEIENNLRLAQLAKDQKPSPDEIKRAERTGLLGAFNQSFQQYYDVSIANMNSSKLLDNLGQMDGKSEIQAREGLLAGLNQAKTNFFTNFNSNVASYKDMDPESIEYARKEYMARFDSLEQGIKGSLSSFKVQQDVVQYLKAHAQMEYADSAPLSFALTSVFGDQTIAAILPTLISAGNGGQNRTALQNDVQHFIDMFKGQAKMRSDAVGGKADAAAATAAMGDFNRRVGQLSPQQLTTWGNGAGAVAEKGFDYDRNNPSQVQAATDIVSSAAALANFDSWAKDPAHAKDKAELGAKILNLNFHNVQVIATSLKPVTLQNQQPVTGGPAASTADNSKAPGLYGIIKRAGEWRLGIPETGKVTERGSVTYNAAYNPSSGQMELNITDGSGKTVAAPELSRQVPPELKRAVDKVNQSLNAVTHLHEYAGDDAKQLTEAQLKYVTIQGAGIPLRAGMAPPAMPKAEVKKPGEAKAPEQPIAAPVTTGDGWKVEEQ